jgi:glycine/D-amino acid oxidase-like deaminating enzyme
MKGLIAAVSVPALTLWPYKFVTALLERVVEMGAFLYTETPVEKISTTNSGDDNNDSIITITTPRGVTKAKKVIYATNAYTSAVLPQYRNVIVPYRGQNSILVPLAKGQGHQPHLTYTRNLFHSGSSPGNADYLVPRPDGNIILGGGAGAYRKDEADRNAKWFDSVDDATLIDPGVKRHFDGVMARCFRGWEDCEATAAMTWSGSKFASSLISYKFSSDPSLFSTTMIMYANLAVPHHSHGRYSRRCPSRWSGTGHT